MDLPATSFQLIQLWIRLGGRIDFGLPAFILESFEELIHSWCFVIFACVAFTRQRGRREGVGEQQQTHTGVFFCSHLWQICGSPSWVSRPLTSSAILLSPSTRIEAD